MTKFKMIRETGNNFNINFSLFSTQIPSLETLFLLSLSLNLIIKKSLKSFLTTRSMSKANKDQEH